MLESRKAVSFLSAKYRDRPLNSEKKKAFNLLTIQIQSLSCEINQFTLPFKYDDDDDDVVVVIRNELNFLFIIQTLK
jgi:hypothetical protein